MRTLLLLIKVQIPKIIEKNRENSKKNKCYINKTKNPKIKYRNRIF
jgi:hypothetical protein